MLKKTIGFVVGILALANGVAGPGAPRRGGVLHIPPAELRTRCVGAGPFKLQEWRLGEFFEYVRNPDYTRTSPRNHTGYCNQEVMSLIDRQSQELDPGKRHALVADIQRKLEEDAARPVMGWGLDFFFAQWPHVKGLVPNHSIYNYGRLQDVWLDR